MAKPKSQNQSADEVFQPPKILREPQSRQVPLSGKISLRVTATGKPLPDYQWYHNGKKIAGATSDQLVLQHLRRDQGGAYTCEAKNFVGKVMSRAAMVSFLPEQLPELIVEPAEAKIPEGRSFSFRIVSPDANKLKDYRLQWVFNGKKIRGAVGTKLEFLQVKKKYSGEYKVRIVLDDKILTSNCVKLTAVPNESREEVKSALDELTREVLVKKPEPLFFDPNEPDPEDEVVATPSEASEGKSAIPSMAKSATPSAQAAPNAPPPLSLEQIEKVREQKIKEEIVTPEGFAPAPAHAQENEVNPFDYPLTENSQISLSTLPPLPELDENDLAEIHALDVSSEMKVEAQHAEDTFAEQATKAPPSKPNIFQLRQQKLDLSTERKRLFLEKFLWHWQERSAKSAKRAA